MAVATFTALQTPLLDAGTQRTSYTWQQKFIEWERKINAALPIATTIALGTVKPDGTTITVTAGGVISAVTSAVHFADDEVPTGVVDSLNVTFTLAHPPSPVESLILCDAGLVQAQGIGLDYTLAGNVITFATAPTVGPIRAWYRY